MEPGLKENRLLIREKRDEFLYRFKNTCIFLSPPINAYFLGVDFLLSNNFVLQLKFRIAMVLLSILSLLFIDKLGRWTLPYGIVFAWIHAFCTSCLSVYYGDLKSYYMISAPLVVALGSIYLFIDNWRIVVVANLGIFIISFLTGIIAFDTFDYEFILNHIALTATFTGIAGVMGYEREKLKTKEFSNRRALKKEVDAREDIIQGKVKEIVSVTEHVRQQEQQLQTVNQLAGLAVRVAHDIRSPLTALGIATSELTSMPEERRRLISSSVARINDIANGLLNYKKTLTVKRESELVALGPLLDRIVSEKRTERADNSSIKLSFVEDTWQFGMFVKLPVLELARHISNLLNNSFEALTKSGEIIVTLTTDANMAFIRIADNGIGMSAEILKKIGHQGYTTKPLTGHGEGVFHARTFFKYIGGNLTFNSQANLGTTAVIAIPLTKTPSWFASAINIQKYLKLVIIDDDLPIYELWKKRIKCKEMLFLGNVNEAVEHQVDSRSEFFLVDYDFRNSEIDGISVIEKLNIVEQAILVTSQFDEQLVIEKCEKLGIKILPKSWIPYVPIQE